MQIVDKIKNFFKHKNGTYAALLLNDTDRDELFDFVSNFKFPTGTQIVPKEDYHTTIIYSKAPFPRAEDDMKTFFPVIKEYTSVPIRYEIFGKPEDENKALVILVESSNIRSVENLWRNAGATSSYVEYCPHITVAYGTFSKEFVSDLVKPDMVFHYDKYEVKPLKGT